MTDQEFLALCLEFFEARPDNITCAHIVRLIQRYIKEQELLARIQREGTDQEGE